MSFNPITNQPLTDYKAQNMKKEYDIKDYNHQNQQMEQYNNQERLQQMKGNQREKQIPIEYNPYKQPYSVYQGHP